MPYRSVFRSGLFDGRRIIVTGGGSGIGRCIAHELAALGAEVILVGRKPDKLQAVRAEIAADGGRAEAAPCDIRDEQAVAELAERVGTAGTIDGLVNNAGGQFRARAEDITPNGWRAVVDTNLTGAFMMSRACYRKAMAARGGAIVNILADLWNGMPDMAHSGAARAGLLNFTETAAAEWAPVRVNAVAPGWIASSGMDTYPPEAHALLRSLPDHTPARRLGLEAEVSAAIVFLLSDAAAFISGACLRVDGGAPCARRHWDMPQRPPTPRYEGFHLATTPKVFTGKSEA